jgi:hypothetical protein
MSDLATYFSAGYRQSRQREQIDRMLCALSYSSAGYRERRRVHNCLPGMQSRQRAMIQKVETCMRTGRDQTGAHSHCTYHLRAHSPFA